jgi:hypothetical protein
MHPRLARRTTVDPRAWTGPTGAQLRRLTEQLREACPDAVRGRRRAPGFPDRVLLLVLAHRTNPTRQQPAVLFGPSDSTVHRVVDRPAPHLADLPGPPPTDRREPWVVDGPLIPVHDKHRTAKSKNDRRSVNTRIVCRARDRRIVAAGEARPGNRNDTIVFKETLGRTLPNHARPIGDGGHRGHPRITSPRRGADGRIARDRHHRRFRKRRARAAHTVARLKDHRILRQCRRRGEGIDHAIAGVAALHHLKPETP